MGRFFFWLEDSGEKNQCCFCDNCYHELNARIGEEKSDPGWRWGCLGCPADRSVLWLHVQMWLFLALDNR
jgi:hypothetical protein